MSDSTGFLGYKKSHLVILAIVALVAALSLRMGPAWLKGAVFLALGLAGVMSVILVRTGKKGLESLRPFRTWMGYLFFSIGFVGYGLDQVLPELGWHPPQGSTLYQVYGAVILLMILGLFIGPIMEWRASRRRKARAG